MPAAEERNSRCVYIVSLGLRWPFDVNTVDVNANLLILDGTVVKMIRQVLQCWIWVQVKLMSDLNGNDNITI